MTIIVGQIFIYVIIFPSYSDFKHNISIRCFGDIRKMQLSTLQRVLSIVIKPCYWDLSSTEHRRLWLKKSLSVSHYAITWTSVSLLTTVSKEQQLVKLSKCSNLHQRKTYFKTLPNSFIVFWSQCINFPNRILNPDTYPGMTTPSSNLHLPVNASKAYFPSTIMLGIGENRVCKHDDINHQFISKHIRDLLYQVMQKWQCLCKREIFSDGRDGIHIDVFASLISSLSKIMPE